MSKIILLIEKADVISKVNGNNLMIEAGGFDLILTKDACEAMAKDIDEFLAYTRVKTIPRPEPDVPFGSHRSQRDD